MGDSGFLYILGTVKMRLAVYLLNALLHSAISAPVEQGTANGETKDQKRFLDIHIHIGKRDLEEDQDLAKRFLDYNNHCNNGTPIGKRYVVVGTGKEKRLLDLHT